MAITKDLNRGVGVEGRSDGGGERSAMVVMAVGFCESRAASSRIQSHKAQPVYYPTTGRFGHSS